MSKCITCRHALYDGMCLAKGQFTMLDSPSCELYEPTLDSQVLRLKRENAELRELASRMWGSYCFANSGYETYLTFEQDVAIRERIRLLGIEVSK